MTPTQTIEALLKTIDESVNTFVKGLTPIQEQTYKKLIELVKELDLDAGGNLKNNLANIRVVGKLKSELENIILSDKYVSHVGDFLAAYNEVQDLQNQYFSIINVKFAEKKVFDEVRKQAIQTTVESLTEQGIGVNYVDEIKAILNTNITSGGSYAELTKQLSNYVLGDKDNEGGLIKYARQTATDSINQYNATYNKVVSDDLNISWYQYVGSLITTSRPFCKALVEKRYFHVSEISDLLKGRIDGKQIHINKKTGLPDGMIEDTNQNNFFVQRGGYGCGHQIFPVPYAVVPQALRDKFD